MSSTTFHLIAVPYPGRGHVNPMFNICRILPARLPPNAVISIVVTEEWFSLLGGDAAAPPGVCFRTIPNVIPSETVRFADFVGFVEAVYTKLEGPFERLLDQLEVPATAIIADTYLPWTVDVGKRRGIPVCSLFTMSASFFSVLLHYDRLREESEADDELLPKDISDDKSLHVSDLRSSFHRTLHFALQAISQSTKAQCLILTTAYELEPHIIDSLRSHLHLPPILPIGPMIPYLTLQQTILRTPSYAHEDCLPFLNSQAQGSVVYVSLGSFMSVSRSQLDELALGLQASNFKFLWVARGESSRLQKMFGTGEGIVVPWCDQLKVLCHPSIGAFLTHCGWNSTMEAVYSGVPMLTFPISADQPANSRLVVDNWGVGIKVNGDAMVGREKIAEMVKRVMDLGGGESSELRNKVLRLREACRSAIEHGGSSSVNLDGLVELLLQAKTNSAAAAI